MAKIVIKEGTKEKVIGDYDRNKNVFTTTRDYTKHLIRKTNSWAIDYKLLKELLVPNNATIKIRDTKRRKTYIVSAKDFYNLGREIEYLNHRKQVSLNLNNFEVI